jgi:hypothetical protein
LTRISRRCAAPLALAAYLVLVFVLLSRTWLGGGLGHRLVGVGSDPLGSVWFLAWLPHALEHGHSPLFSTALMAPQGANLLNSTAISLPSLLFWPFTAAVGPVVSYDLLATVAIAVSAWTAYFAFGRLTTHRFSAWIGGLLYGFGGFMTGQASAHVCLLIVVFPALAAMLLDDVRRRSPTRTGLLLGLCAVAQVFIDEEVLATSAIMAALALAFVTWRARPPRAIVGRYARAFVTAAIVFAILAGPALLYQFFGPQHVSGVIVTSGRYVNDLESFVVPNAGQLFSSAGSRQLTAGFSGYDGEGGGYLGLALIALLLLAGWRLRRRALPAGLLLLCATIFSLGPHLRVGGHDTGILLPWVVPNHLPLFEDIIPDRFNLYVWLAAAALLVLLIDDLRSRPLRGSRALSVAVCALALISILPTPTPSEVLGAPSVVANAATFQRILPTAKTVLITPAADGQFAMYAQAEADFAYKIPDGAVFVPTPQGPSYGMRHGPLLYALAALAGTVSTQSGRTSTDRLCLAQLAHGNKLSQLCRSHYRHALQALRVDAVIVSGIGSATARRRYNWFFGALLGPARAVTGASVFVVRPGG